MSLLQLLLKGGWVMVPLLLLSVLTVYGLFERLLTLRKHVPITSAWEDMFYKNIQSSDWENAKLMCEQQKNEMVSNVLQAGLAKLPNEPNQVEKIMEALGDDQIHQLEKNLSLLSTIASIAPMLGFLGTVIGMIQAFMAMAQTNTPITPQILANGIYEAMITTASGLIIGISADVSYKYVLNKIEKITYQTQKLCNALLTRLPVKFTYN
jgi:biopolymer transport protein ExbB